MRHIWKIFKRDMKAIVTNYAALIVVIALCILPSLYAWFNIKASWDPYGIEATSGIQIGVVNLDVGADLGGKSINIGDMVVEELKKNEQLGWRFVDKETGMEAVKNGSYYAMITIPEDFSENLTSIIRSDIKKGEIIYTVNEKINAIAPKLTDKGVTSLQNMISKTVVGTVSETIFDLANEIGINLEEQIPNISSAYEKLKEIQGKFDTINTTVDNAGDGVSRLKKLLDDVEAELPKIKTTIENGRKLGEDVKTFLTDSKALSEQVAPTIKQDLVIIGNVAAGISSHAESVKDAIEGNMENAPAMIEQLKEKVVSLSTMAESLVTVLDRFNKLSPQKPFDSLIADLSGISVKLTNVAALLDQLSDQVENGEGINFTILDQIMEVGTSVEGVATSLSQALETTLIPQLNAIFDKAYETADGAVQLLDVTVQKLPQVSNLLNLAFDSVDKGKEGINYAKQILPKAEQMINEFLEKVGDINTEEGLQNLVDLLKADVTSRSEFLATPVEITEEKLYPMQNYGTGMTPFYTVLCLWVGILLLVSILSVEAHGEYKSYEIYFGKLLLFLVITIIQALIVSFGDLYLLGIYCVNKALFVLGSVLVSVTFTLILYSLVSVFGNVGKVIGIILLVLQVAGSGGTFPIQLTPKFFQVINPYLPFTYGISFAREAIGGVVQEVLTKDIIIMGIFIGAFLIMALVLKKPINNRLKKFVDRFAESGISEH